MKITVENSKFFDFLLTTLIEDENQLEQLNDRLRRFNSIRDEIIKHKNIFSRFLDKITQSSFDETCKVVDPVFVDTIWAAEQRIKYLLSMIDAIAYAIQCGLTNTTEIEYDSWIAKKYMESYAS